MSLIKSGAIVAGGTLASRISGFARDILVAKYLGATDHADVWVAAFRFPNMFRRMIAEGAFNAAFMPVYSQIYTEHGSEKADQFAGRTLSRMSMIVGGVTLFLQLLMPYLVYLIAPGYSEELTNWLVGMVDCLVQVSSCPVLPDLRGSEKISLTVVITIICLPYAGLMFLAAIQSSILNFHNKFMHAAIVAVILNLTLIVSLLGSAFFHYSPLFGMAWGSFIAGILQCLMLYAVLRKAGFKLKFVKPKPDEYQKKFVKLFVPGLISGGVTQINLVIGSIIASFTPGAMAYLYYADRIYQLPLSLIGVSLSIVLLPTLVKSFQSHNSLLAQTTLSRALEFASFLSFPAMFALAVIPNDIVTVLFLTGKFTLSDVDKTSLVLMIYGLGIPAFIGIKLFSPAYYAHQNTKTPMIYASWSILVNTILTLALFPFFSFYAIAVASVASAFFNCIMLYRGLQKKEILNIEKNSFKIIKKVIVCCVLMSAILLLTKYFIIGSIVSYNRVTALLLIILGIISYVVLCYSLQVIPKASIKAYLKRS